MKIDLSTKLALANVAEMCQLRQWFHSANEQQSWGGDDFYYPCNEQQFLALLCRQGTQSFSLLVQHTDELMGFGQLCDRFDCHHLARLVIHPSHRGKGLAKTLICELIIHALTQQPRDISLYVHRHNTIAIKCYQSLGFDITIAPEMANERLHFMKLNVSKAIDAANQYLQRS